MNHSLKRAKIAGFSAGLVAVAVLVYRLSKDSRKYGGLRAALTAFFTGHEVFPVVDGYIPILGNLIGFIKNAHRLFDWQVETITPHGGKPVVLRRPGDRVVMLSDPRHVQHIWVDSFEDAERCRGGLGDLLKDMFGNGIFNSDGPQWKKHRKIASRLFSMRHLKNRMFEDFQAYSHKMVAKLAELSQDRPGEAIDIQDMFLRLTMDGFFSSAFGIPADNVETAPEFNEFSYYFDKCTQLSAGRLYDRPFWKLERFFGTAKETLMGESRTYIRTAAQEMIDHARSRSASADRTDLLSLFLKQEDLSEVMSDDDLLDMCLNFIIAGRDTTAMTMSWALVELCRHPDVLARVIEELASAEELTFDSVNQFEYTEKVLLEAGRLHPLVPLMGRVAVRDIKLPGGDDWIIREGDTVFVCSYVMGRAPYVWKDPLVFDPERFSSGLKTFESSRYTNFNMGKRICLGRHVALLEMKVAFWHFFKHFRYTIDPQVLLNVTYETSFTLEIAHGLPVHLSPVQAGAGVVG